MALVGLGAFGSVGLLILALGVSQAMKQFRFDARAERATAEVLRMETRTQVTGTGKHRTTSTIDCAILAFRDADGRRLEAEYTFGLLEASLKQGDTLEVRFLTGDPETVVPDTFAAQWLSILSVLGLGAVFVAGGVLTYVMVKP